MTLNFLACLACFVMFCWPEKKTTIETSSKELKREQQSRPKGFILMREEECSKEEKHPSQRAHAGTKEQRRSRPKHFFVYFFSRFFLSFFPLWHTPTLFSFRLTLVSQVRSFSCRLPRAHTVRLEVEERAPPELPPLPSPPLRRLPPPPLSRDPLLLLPPDPYHFVGDGHGARLTAPPRPCGWPVWPLRFHNGLLLAGYVRYVAFSSRENNPRTNQRTNQPPRSRCFFSCDLTH